MNSLPSAERVLITGGSGFIGSRLAQRLVAKGYDVHLLLRSGSSATRLDGLNFTPWTADLRDAAEVQRLIEKCQPTVVYHLAGRGVLPAQKDRNDVLSANVLGTANLLDALRAIDYRAFVHAGSGAEYGPCDEALTEDAPLKPATDYASAKAAASVLCLAEARQGKPVTVVRIFAAYGPGEAASRLVPDVIAHCSRGERPKVSAGIQRRDMVFVDDVVDLLMTAANTPAAMGRVLHAATGVDHSVRDVVEMIRSVMGGPGAMYGERPIRAGEPTRYLASIERTTALTGWQPRFDLRAGLTQTWEWQRRDQWAALRSAG